MALTKQTASLVAVIQAWMMMIHKILVKRYAFARLPYGPMLARDRERMANLNFIYNNCEIESIQMLRMGRGPFYELVKRFREGVCSRIASTRLWKSKFASSFMS